MVSRLSAAFDAPYMPVVLARPCILNGGPGECFAVALDTLTIQPSPRSSIAGSTACARSSGACTFTSKVTRRRFNGISEGSAYIAAAALFTRMSIGPPSCSAASGTMRARSSPSVRSAATTATVPP